MATDFKFKQGKQKVEEVLLPQLYTVSMTQWLDVIGDTAFITWLKFFSWTKQEDVLYTNEEYADLNSVSASFSAIAKKLGVGNETLQNKILKPLWNVGLIDILENENKGKITSTELILIVYRYPKNELERSFKPIEIIRNYDTEYTKNNRVFHVKDSLVPAKDINKSNSPLAEVLEKQNKRLTDDKIDVKIILDLWDEENKKSDGMSEEQFADVINHALTYTKDTIGSKGSVQGFFNTVLKRYREKNKK